jgi:hypothetical protein
MEVDIQAQGILFRLFIKNDVWILWCVMFGGGIIEAVLQEVFVDFETPIFGVIGGIAGILLLWGHILPEFF